MARRASTSGPRRSPRSGPERSSPEPTQRTPSGPEPGKPDRTRIALRIALLLGVIAALGAIIFSVDLTPTLSHVDVAILSGAEGGHYHHSVGAVAQRARHEGGVVRNLSSAGSMENLERLARDGCEADFALVQEGLDWTEADPAAYERLELAARLPRSEMLLMLGREGDLVHDFRDLRGSRIGAGPEGSGTAVVMRRLFALPGFERLEVELVHGPVAEQLAQAGAGELDLAAMVVFPDAPMATRAVRASHLSIAGFSSADAVARHLDGARAAVLPAGHYDAIRGLPREDLRVLAVDTLLVAGPCARRSEINAVLSLLAHELPGFIAHNREVPPPAHTESSEVAREFYDNHGPPLVDRYLPRVVDVVPLSNVMTLVMAISVLFNIMSFLNRFRLWRLDAGRHEIEDELRDLFGGKVTRKEIDGLDPREALSEPEQRQKLEDVITRLNDMLARCRRYATSMLVPMGQEMVYRYQENLILENIAILRRFQRRQAAADRGEDWDEL